MAARQLKIPVTSSFHTHFEHYSQHYGLGWLKQPVIGYLRKLHNCTEATFVPTLATKQALEAQGYRNLHILSRGVNPDLFNPHFRSQALREQWGMKPDDLAVIHVGRLAPEKNLGLVQSAFAAIQAQHPRARLIWVGDGPSRTELASKHPDYIFAGIQTGPELAAHYASADLFLFASLTDTFGNVVLEAMASGNTVLAYACAGAAQLIHSGENGVLASPGNEAEFLAHAVDLARSPQRRKALASAARITAETLSWDHIHATLEAHLMQIVRKHRRLRAHEESFIQLLPI